MKILIAEDDSTSRLMIAGLLEKWGYETISVDNGDEASAVLTGQDAPQLAVLDWMMPGKDGVDVCREARAREGGIRPYIVLVTVLGCKEDVVAGLEAGADDYVTKPFDQGELRARLEVGRKMIELQTVLADRVEELEEALEQIRSLHGVLPICMYCHKIRDDKSSWQQLEDYIKAHSGAEFSHGICPTCIKKQYPEYANGTPPADSPTGQ